MQSLSTPADSAYSKISKRTTAPLKVTYPKKGIQRAIFHVFCDNHDWIRFCNNTLKEYHIWMFKLTHDGRLSKEVISCFVRTTRLQSLNGNIDFCSTAIWWQL